MKTPLILEMKGNSLDDGPGIRTVVFFKGCPLSCTWCHNPESKKTYAEIGYEHTECVNCNSCMETCSENALSKENLFFIDRDTCTLCFQCVETCPSGALSRVGKSMSIEEILSGVMRDKPFYDTSGGGVTLSGGEPTLFMDFTAQLAGTLKDNGIHILLETCGLFDFKTFREKLYPYLDMIYFDIKLMDPAMHRKFCGTNNQVILNNFQNLHDSARSKGAAILPRVPLIPGITDTIKNISAIADYLVRCGAPKVQLLPYHPLWQEKTLKIGIQNPMGETPDMKKWLDTKTIENCKTIFTQAGIEV